MAISYTLPILVLSVVDLKDSGSICISDLSTYSSVPSSAFLQITPPNGYLTKNVAFVPGQVNVYRCADLGITCSDTGCTPLPDGIYVVQYSIQSPQSLSSSNPGAITSIEVKFIKIDNIRCKFNQAFVTVENAYPCCENPNFVTSIKELEHIKLYIDGSVAQCNSNNYKLSHDFYQKADKMLDKLKCKFPAIRWKKDCGCN